ncbi:uncharacterized protein [Palaemon carinicauda]|uniref:uncharacterized protein n=1 Tax=Palaemon carinicauda TaxID=392227 RepID=UPI0035B661A1
MKIILLISSILAVTCAHPAADENGYDDSSEETPGNLDDTFQFAYAVASPEHGTYHGHQSTRDDQGHTSGSYYSLGADGHWRQTIYADKGLGFQALSNQQPAESPPSQVSDVNYQIFVHPGATAVSSSGSGPFDTAALIGQPVASAGPIAAPQVSFDVRNEVEERENLEENGGSGAATPAPVLPSSLAAAAAPTAPAAAAQIGSAPLSPSSVVFQEAAPVGPGAAVQTTSTVFATPVAAAQTGAALSSPVSVNFQQAAPGPINFGTPAPVNVAIQSSPQPAINVQPVLPPPIDIRLQTAAAPAINVQPARPSPVNVRLQAAPSPVINVQAPQLSPVSTLQATPAPVINVQATRPSPLNIAVRNQAPGLVSFQGPALRGSIRRPINVQGAALSPVNVAVRTSSSRPISLQGASRFPVNVGVRTSPAGQVRINQAALSPINFAVRNPTAGPVFLRGARPAGTFQNAGRGVVAVTTIPLGILSGGTRGSFVREIPFGTRLVGNRHFGTFI